MILDYVTHQRRLFPALAATYALHLGMLRLKAVLMKVGGALAVVAPRWCMRGIMQHAACSRRGTCRGTCRVTPSLAALPHPKTCACTPQGGPDVGKTVHVVSSGLKAGATWHRVRILQDCRECCGGAWGSGLVRARRSAPAYSDPC